MMPATPIWMLLTAATWTVDPADPHALAAVQDAVDLAADGDRVDIAAGTYPECVDLGGKDLSLVGAGAELTLIDGGGACEPVLGATTGETAGLATLSLSNDGGRCIEAVEATLSLDSVWVVGCGSSDSEGGGLSMLGGRTTATQSRFDDNQGGSASAIRVACGGALELADSTVSDNHSDLGSAVLLDAESDATVSRTTLSGNRTGGESVILIEGGALLLDGATIEGDPSAPEGGGIRTTGGATLIVSDSSFSRLDQKQGGAIWMWSGGGQLQVSGSTFQDTTAWHSGGAIHVTGARCQVRITDSVFSDHRADAKAGGAISVTDDTDLYLARVEIRDSVGTDYWTHSHYGGGAVSVYGGSLEVFASLFEGNVVHDAEGGAIHQFGGDLLRIEGSVFRDNESDWQGGAVSAYGVDDVQIRASVFEGNQQGEGSDTSGGAVSVIVSDSVVVEDSWFCDNRVSGLFDDNGGGLLAAHVIDGRIVGNVFLENRGSVGGAMSVHSDGAFEIAHNTIVGNTGEHSTVSVSDGPVSVGDNILAWNSGGPALFGSEHVDVELDASHNAWWANDEDDGGAASGTAGAIGDLFVDPSFVDFVLDADCGDDLGLAADSPLIGAGSSGDIGASVATADEATDGADSGDTGGGDDCPDRAGDTGAGGEDTGLCDGIGDGDGGAADGGAADGGAADGGAADGGAADGGSGADGGDEGVVEEEGSKGCSSVAISASWLVWLPLIVVGRRRRG